MKKSLSYPEIVSKQQSFSSNVNILQKISERAQAQ